MANGRIAFFTALVVDAKEQFGTGQAVKLEKDGGFVVPAKTQNSNGIVLKINNLAA